MNKRFTKIICFLTAAVAAAGVTVSVGCGGSYSSKPLDGNIFTEGKAKSNGGFAVEKGDYIYFLNGVENNTAENTFNTPVKGAIYRIKKSDFSDNNYSDVDRVVPLVAYSGDYNSGLFIYGDRIYYSTPSTEKNSAGETLNTNLDMKSSKLDGTDTMKNAYVQFPSLTTEYRYVEGADGKVYLIYLATDEKLYEESTGVKNLHSLNTESGENTLLAYNVDTVMFDAEDKTNPRVYYTMNVKNYATDSNYSYNQVYSVTADATKATEYDFSGILGWDEETDRYINCGELIFDGIGKNNEKTPFNFAGDDINLSDYTYTLKKYQNGTLFYTRKTSVNDGQYLFSFSDGVLKDTHNPVKDNAASEARILTDGSSAGDFKYFFKDGKLEKVIKVEGEGGITVNYVGDDGKLQKDISTVTGSKYFYIVKGTSATILFADENYLYYTANSVINRVSHNGAVDDYEGLPETDDTDDYNAVKIFDLAPASSWYTPEIFDGQLIFASETENMSSYKYVMACDLRKDGKPMNNAELAELNKKFTGIGEIISDFSDSDKYDADVYANLGDALRYAYFTGESEYIKELAEKCNAEVKEGEKLVYSEETLAKYSEFLAPSATNDWKDYVATKEVNHEKLFANRRDYYYSVLGVMNETDAKNYADLVRNNYLKAEPVNEQTWWEGLDTASRVWFIIGMCAIGILVIGGAAVLGVVLVRRKKNKMPEYSTRKIKVDTTDDKDIDVYGTDEE